MWGEVVSSSFCKSLKQVYEEVVHWRKNCFNVPLGKAGKSFVSELARLYDAFASGSALESVALMATTVLPILVLQIPHRRSKAKEHSTCLERRLKFWKDGDLTALVMEGRAIQQRLPKCSNPKQENRLAHTFANLMFKGKTHAALDLLANAGKGSLLHLDQPADVSDPNSKTVREVLVSKHPVGLPVAPDSVLPGEPPEIHPIIFDSIDAHLIRATALRTKGAAGPSGMDAHAWRRLCTAFKTSSSSLCQSLADVAKRLCSSYIDPLAIAPFLACRLIALDKCPGVRPIGIGEIARRIIAKSLIVITHGDIQDAAGSSQLCAGQISGCEAAVHSVRESFLDDDTEAALLVDASNAFNSLNRMAALHNIRYLCPSISTYLINSYRSPTELFIDGDVIHSQEGTTQGDPMAMPFYAIATVPLIKKLPTNVKQTWYADDAAATGKITKLRGWWDQISRWGPCFGYNANASKTWIVTKPEFESEAIAAFADTNVRITVDGRPHLGAPLGCQAYVDKFVSEKVEQWSKELKLLSAIGKTQPHAAFAAFTHGMSSKWSFLTRTIPCVSDHLNDLEVILQSDFIPNITGRPPPNDTIRKLLALPARLGGLGITNPSFHSDRDFGASILVTAPLRELFHSQNTTYSYQALANQITAKADIRHERREQVNLEAASLGADLSPTLKKAMDLAQERGASSWLTTLPIAEHGFCLHKGAFGDALALRYGWPPTRTPTSCVCGSNFTIEHVLSCPRGGFPSIRHNEVRDLTATLMTEVCNDVCVEPVLQEVTDEVMTLRSAITTAGARLDVSANGFWGGRHEKTFLDVRVFNPYAPSNRQSSLAKCYRKHEQEKKRAYEQRITEVEHATFTPIVLSASGGLAKEATVFYKRLASLLSEKWNQSYSTTMGWLRCTISFSLLRSAVQCIRGARSSRGNAAKGALPVDLVSAEAEVSPF